MEEIKKEPITVLFILLNILIFVIVDFTGGSENTVHMIACGAAYPPLILEEGDSFCVRVYDDSGKNVTVKESSDTLKVRSTKKLSKTRKVHISYPEDVKLQELEIEDMAALLG